MNKILYISSFDISLGKGPSVNERTFIKGLVNSNEDHTVYCIHGKLTKPIDFKIENSFSLINSPQKHPIYLLFIEIYKFIVALYLILFKRINIVIVRVELFPFSIFLLSIIFKNKIYIKTFGGGLMDSLKNKGYKNLNQFNNLLFSVILKRSLGIDTVSLRFKNAIIDRFKIDESKVFVVDNGVDLTMFKKQKNAKEFVFEKYNIDIRDFDVVLGYAGNLSHIRGGLEVVTAVSFLNKAFPDKKVGGIICGGGVSDSILSEEIVKLNEQNNIFLTGNVSFSDMPYFISCLDIGFSILEKKYQGASAQKVRQYIACNVFTITTPGQEEFVENYGVGKVFLYEEKSEINHFLYESILYEKYKIKSPKEVLELISIKSKVQQRINHIKERNALI